MAEINVGDTVEVSFKGEITYVGQFGHVDVEVNDYIFTAPKSACTVVTPALQVGDIITPENEHRLPEDFILADKDGTAWQHYPHVASGCRETVAPFKLVYIHDEQ